MSKLEKIMFTTEALSTERSKDSSVKKYSLCALCAHAVNFLLDRHNRIAGAKFEEV
jgi:hypothetical protein